MARDEDREQQMLIKWTQQPSIRRAYPKLKLMYHIPNERHCDAREGQRLKLMGVKSGVPDLHLPTATSKHHSLFIELKAIGGKPSDNQLWWQAELNKQGNLSVICYGWRQAADVIIKYLTEVI